MPLLTLSYKYFLLRHSFSTLPFCIFKPIFLVAASIEKPKNSSEPQQSFKSSIFFLSGKKWLSTSPSLRSILSCPLFLLPYFYLLQIYLLSPLFPSISFFCSSNLQTFRNWLRKSWSLPSNPTFNVSGRWVTRILPIWSMRKQIGSPFGLRISL